MTQFNRQYNCVFCNIPRTASSSMNEYLPAASARTMTKFLAEEEGNFDNIFKFAFVRDPYDRFVSAFCHLKMYNTFAEINEFLASGGAQAAHKYESVLFTPQTDYIYDKDDTLLVDFVGRFERLDEDWKHVCRRIGLDAKLEHIQASRREGITLNEKSKEIVFRYYARDFVLLGYER